MGLAPLDPITAQLFRRTLMKLGISLPLSDIQGESATVCDFAQAAESLGYHHLAAPDHVLGVNVASRPDWPKDRTTSRHYFHDPFVLFGFLSACTQKIEFSTQVLILPQRQTGSPSKRHLSTCSRAGGSGSASGSVGTRWSSWGSTRISTTVASARRSRCAS